MIKRNRCNRQYSARLSRWLDRLAHFDIAIQHIAGNNLKFTDLLSRTPVEKATNEDAYSEQYVINILLEDELNAKYGPLFVDQPQNAPERTKTTEENVNNKSHRNRTFEKNRDVNKNYERTKSASNKRRQNVQTESSIQTLNSNSIQNSKSQKELPLFKSEMDKDYSHWGATAKITEIIRRRIKSPETLRLV